MSRSEDGGHLTDVTVSGVRIDGLRATEVTGRRIRLVGADLRDVLVRGAQLRGVELVDVEIEGELENVRVNGIEIAPLVEAELSRRFPDYALLRPTTPDGFRAAWPVVERLWAGTIARSRVLESHDPDLLHERVDEEWSFVETLRHLLFATDAWVRRGMLGDPSPWHPLDLPWDEMPDTEGIPRDRLVRPGLDEVLALRSDRMAGVAAVIEDLTDERLAGHTEPVDAPGWPPAHAFEWGEPLRVVLNEEWWHRRYAERDLAVLAERAGITLPKEADDV